MVQKLHNNHTSNDATTAGTFHLFMYSCFSVRAPHFSWVHFARSGIVAGMMHHIFVVLCSVATWIWLHLDMWCANKLSECSVAFYCILTKQHLGSVNCYFVVLDECGHCVLCFWVEFMACICVVFQLGCGAMLHCHGAHGMSLYLLLCHFCLSWSFGWGISDSLSMEMSSQCS